MKIPDWFQVVVLSLSSFRVWRLLAEDTILDRPRRRLLRLGDWKEEGDLVPATYRKTTGDFLACWWCAGFWVGLAWWGAWQEWPHGTMVTAIPFAISAVLAGSAKLLTDE